MKIRIASAAIAMTACMAMLLASPARLQAATLTVTSTADSGLGSLREAIASAADGDKINFSVAGTILLTGGELLVKKSLTITGPGPSSLVVDANDASRVFHIYSNTVVTIASLTITNGFIMFGGSGGGGVLNDHAMLTISNCILSGNAAYGNQGGGIFNSGFGGSASVQIINSLVSGNTAYSDGGGIFNSAGNVQIVNSTLSGNSVMYGSGGGIVNDAGNNLGFGGSATLTVINSTLSGNSASGFGGGIYNSDGATVEIANSTLTANVIDLGGFGGGGILNRGVLEIANSTLSGNIASAGGGSGIFNLSCCSRSASAGIVNSTLSGNSTDDYGGGIRNYTDGGSLTVSVINSTLCGNSAGSDSGGGINSENYNGTLSVEIGSTILSAGASGKNIINIFGAITVTSLGYNLSSDDGSALLTSTGDQINTDPMLLPLRDNGGPTLTHDFLGCSPARDQGKILAGSTGDQRGASRTIDDPGIANAAGGDGTDIGALEAQGKGLPEQIDSLNLYLQLLPIDSGVKNALLVKLQDASKGFNTNNKPKTCSALQDFISQCNAQFAKRKLTATQVNALICEATRIRALLGCK